MTDQWDLENADSYDGAIFADMLYDSHSQQGNQLGRTNLLNVSLPSYYQLILQWYRPLQLNGRVTHTLFTDRYIGTTFFESSLAGCVNPDFLVNSV